MAYGKQKGFNEWLITSSATRIPALSRLTGSLSVMLFKLMETEKTFIGSSPSKIQWSQRYLIWFSFLCVAFIVISYMNSTFIPIITLAVFFLISFSLRLPIFERKTYIKVSGGILSIHNRNSVLWKTDVKDITSIELEESEQTIPSVTQKALLIRNNKNDSYYLPLDRVTFKDQDPNQLVHELNEIKNRA